MALLSFKTVPYVIDNLVIIRIPESESLKLSSRSQVMTKGTMNDTPLEIMLEPDGWWSHWFAVSADLQEQASVTVGQEVTLTLEPSKDWPEPAIPDDIEVALLGDNKAYDQWKSVTTMARYEWIRWVNGTKNPDTRSHRIAVSMSKLRSGEKRPCCFNRAMCTDPHVSKSGRLILPKEER